MQMRVWPSVVHGAALASPSKSYTHRALVAASLVPAPCSITGPLDADDTRRTATGLSALGYRVDRSGAAWKVRRISRAPAGRLRTIECGDSGTTLRLLLGRAAIEDRPIRFIGSRRLAIRPLRPLAGVLEAAGATVDLPAPPRTLPAMIRGPIRAGRYRLDSSTSSQFLSSLLMVLPTLDRASAVSLEGGLVSLPYVEATEALLAFHGIRVERRGSRVEIPGAQSYRGRTFPIPGDASSAAYLWAAAAITGGSVTVRGLDLRWPQADLRILALLESGGSRVRRNRDDVTVEGPLGGGLDADLRAAPDLFPLVAVLAAAVPSKSWIRGSPNLRQKESDRLSGAARLCRAMGASVQLRGPSLEVSGSRQPRALRLADSDDHRIVMSAAVAALRAEKPSQIGDSTAVRKSYPGFWHDLRALGAGLSRRP